MAAAAHPLADPLVWELLPLADADRATACRVSKATRRAVTEAWSRAGLSLRAQTAAQTLADARWDALTRLRLRDSAALPIGRLPAPSFDFLARPGPFAGLWELTLRYFKFPRGFGWNREMLPALRVLSIVAIVTPASFADDVDRYAQLFREVVPQLRSLSLGVENVALRQKIVAVGVIAPAPALHTFVNVGGVLGGLTVDAPLRVLEIEGGSTSSIQAIGSAAHGTLERIAIREVSPLAIPALAAFRSLRTASLGMGHAAGADDIEERARCLAHLPATITDLKINFSLSCVGGRHELAVRWPDTPLRHLAALETLCVSLTFPPRGFGSLVRHLLGARPRGRATIRAASALTAELESRLMFAIEEDMYDDEEDLRAVIDDLENIPDATPDDVAACPCKDLVLTGVSVF